MSGFYNFIFGLYEGIIKEKFIGLATYATVIITGAIVSVIVYYLSRTIIVKTASTITSRTRYKWDDKLYSCRFFHRISAFLIPITMSFFDQGIPLLEKLTACIWIYVTVRVIDSLLDTVDMVYKTYEISKTRPIRSVLQVIKVVMYIAGIVCVIAVLADQSPLVLLGGIGAATAVTSLIFKDAIVGFVAGIQLTANDMIRIGDWIEMPKYSADGDVIDLTMTTVKVQNFDKTITSIPAYAMVSDAFVNWRGMESAGGRRIKRSIYVDVSSVCFCSDEMLERLKNVELMNGYIEKKLDEIKEDEERHSNKDVLNTRRLTNIGTFREYITRYLKEHPGINRSMITMVRQRDPGDKGIPLEIYTFTNTTKWVDYENIQSDIFDRIYSVAQEFSIKIYQSPSGADIREIKN